MKKNGQTLLEIVVAVAIILLVLVALVSAVVSANRNAQFAKNQALATQYAHEGLEKARETRDKDWKAFSQRSGTETEILGIFTRQMTYTSLEGGKKMEIKVTVSWTDGAGPHKSELRTSLGEWK